MFDLNKEAEILPRRWLHLTVHVKNEKSKKADSVCLGWIEEGRREGRGPRPLEEPPWTTAAVWGFRGIWVSSARGHLASAALTHSRRKGHMEWIYHLADPLAQQCRGKRL